MKRKTKSVIHLLYLLYAAVLLIALTACGQENQPIGDSGKNQSAAQEKTAAGINQISERLQVRLGTLPKGKDHPSRTSWAGPFTDAALNKSIELAPKDAQLPNLRATMEATGSAKIIVGLKIPFQPMGMLSEAMQAQQTETIANVQRGILDTLGSYNVRNVKTFVHIPSMAMIVDAAALEALAADPRVSFIEEDKMVSANLTQSVPLVHAPTAWAAGYTGAGWSVALLDSGVDKTHPFLSGKVVAEACFLSNGGCPNGSTSMIGAGAAPDAYGHGTSVAGVIAGSDGGVSGVAKNANIIAIKTLDNNGQGYDSDVIRGLDWLYGIRGSRNITAANLSFGIQWSSWATNCDAYYPALKAAVDNLRAANIVTVIPSGNDSNKSGISYPSCISTAVSVGATTKADVVAGYSQSAPILSLLAPGSNIVSPMPGGRWGEWSGTSMAAPHVSGAWALMRQRSPAASVPEVISSLQSSGVPITDTNGITKSRIKLDMTAPTPPPPVVPPRPDGSYPIYRFWSAVHTHHFFTMSAAERDYIIATWPNVWSYEGVSYYAHNSTVAGTSPLYRFWSDPYQGHFFTSSEAERNAFMSNPQLWTYERIAYYVYNYQAPGSSAVYRFWSDLYKGYFYTISAAEKDYVIATWPNVWSYQGVAFYAMP